MRAPETDAVPVAEEDVAWVLELEVLSIAALMSPRVHAAAMMSGRAAAHSRSSRLIPILAAIRYTGIR
ncbi:MAG: hypothetical protein NVSMB53_00820 [Gemmatimonadaceae bacterium]